MASLGRNSPRHRERFDQCAAIGNTLTRPLPRAGKASWNRAGSGFRKRCLPRHREWLRLMCRDQKRSHPSSPASGRGELVPGGTGFDGSSSILALLASERLGFWVAEPADKPGSVLDSHSSRRNVAVTLEQPTRTRRGPRHRVPIWSCSRWGLPCRPVARLAVRSYRTISPLPRASCDAVRRYLSVALSVGSRRPGVTWHRALWSPDFPRHPHPSKWLRMTRLSGRLRHGQCLTRGGREP